MKSLRGRFNQSGTSDPTLIGQFGQTIIGSENLDFTTNGNPLRIGVGDYLIPTGGDLLDTQGNINFRGALSVALHTNSSATIIKVSVSDVNMLSVKTFDFNGQSDINGDFFLFLDLYDENY